MYNSVITPTLMCIFKKQWGELVWICKFIVTTTSLITQYSLQHNSFSLWKFLRQTLKAPFTLTIDLRWLPFWVMFFFWFQDDEDLMLQDIYTRYTTIFCDSLWISILGIVNGKVTLCQLFNKLTLPQCQCLISQNHSK